MTDTERMLREQGVALSKEGRPLVCPADCPNLTYRESDGKPMCLSLGFALFSAEAAGFGPPGPGERGPVYADEACPRIALALRDEAPAPPRFSHAQMDGFLRAARPMMAWLKEHADPMSSAEVTQTGAALRECVMACPAEGEHRG